MSKRTGISKDTLNKYEDSQEALSKNPDDAETLASDLECPKELLLSGNPTRDLAKALVNSEEELVKLVHGESVASHPSTLKPIATKEAKYHNSKNSINMVVRNVTRMNSVVIARRLDDNTIEIEVHVDKKPQLVKGQKELWLAGMLVKYEEDHVTANRHLLVDEGTMVI